MATALALREESDLIFHSFPRMLLFPSTEKITYYNIMCPTVPSQLLERNRETRSLLQRAVTEMPLYHNVLKTVETPCHPLPTTRPGPVHESASEYPGDSGEADWREYGYIMRPPPCS